MERERPGAVLGLEDYLLLAAVVLLPWAFGGVEIWAYRGASFLLVAGAAVALARSGLSGWGLGRGDRLWLLPAFLLALWGGFQIVPLPPQAIRAMSPEGFGLYSAALPGYPGGTDADAVTAVEQAALNRVPEASVHPLPEGPDPRLTIEEVPTCFSRVWRTLSLQPSATQERLFWYLALLMGFLVMRRRVASPERYAVYRTALFILAGALALFALVQDQTWNGKLYWVRKLSAVADPFGPYVNPTHFAGVMELMIPWLVGYAWALVRRGGRAVFKDPRFTGVAVTTVVCLVASIASASKAGAAFLLLSLTLLGLVGAWSWRGRLVVLGLIVGVGLVGFALRTATPLGERVDSYVARAGGDDLLEGRLTTWRSSLQLVKDFPVTGTGFGTFREVYPRYMPAGASKRWAQAHNDFLELTTDGGIVALALASWLLLGFTWKGVRRLRRGKRHVSTSRLGLALGIATLTLHALVDFNHQIPANALLYVAVAAMLVHADTEATMEVR